MPLSDCLEATDSDSEIGVCTEMCKLCTYLLSNAGININAKINLNTPGVTPTAPPVTDSTYYDLSYVCVSW